MLPFYFVVVLMSLRKIYPALNTRVMLARHRADASLSHAILDAKVVQTRLGTISRWAFDYDFVWIQ
jgi:hypothetical protein